MRSFKFLQDNDEDDFSIEPLDDDSPSWMYGSIEDLNLGRYEYDIIREDHYGIRSFLNNFPDRYIITVLSIVGPNGRINNHESCYEDGWGFDILSDLITIEWIRFRYQ